MKRDLKGKVTRETESKTQPTNLLILKSPPEHKNCCTDPAQETSNVDTDTTLTGGFAAKAVIMLLEIWT